MDFDYIKKLENFNIQANKGLHYTEIDKCEKYTILCNNDLKDYWCNAIIDLEVKNKEEFDLYVNEASIKLKQKNRKVSIGILPFMQDIYSNQEKYFEKDKYDLISSEVWQIYNEFENINKIETNCEFKIKLENTTDMKLYSKEMAKCFQTGDIEDPYGNLDPIYEEVYSRYKKNNDKRYTNEFFLVKIGDDIVGVTSGSYDNEIYGIYTVAVKKEFRKKGIGKEIIKKQLELCKNRKLKVTFLQTEDGYYPADMYRNIGFKDLCIQKFYMQK